MDGRQPHVGSPAASSAPGAGILRSCSRAGSLGFGNEPRQRILGSPYGRVRIPLARRGSAEGGEEIGKEGCEEIRREGGEEDRQEIREEGRKEVGEEDREEAGEEDREEAGEEIRRAASRQEEGFRARRSEPQLALEPEAASEEARASLRR